jgi:hypothetical protein
MNSQERLEIIFPDIRPLISSLGNIGIMIIEKNSKNSHIIRIIKILKKTGTESISKIQEKYLVDEDRNILLNKPIEVIEELFNSGYFTENITKKNVKIIIVTKESINMIQCIGLKFARTKDFYSEDSDDNESLYFIEIIFSSLHDIALCAAQKKFDNIVKYILVVIQQIHNTIFDIIEKESLLKEIIEKEFHFVKIICREAIDHDLESSMEKCAYIFRSIGLSAIETGNDTITKEVLCLYNMIGKKVIENNIDKKMRIFRHMKEFFMNILFTKLNDMVFSSYTDFLKLSHAQNLDEIQYLIKEHLEEMKSHVEKENNDIVIEKIDKILNM